MTPEAIKRARQTLKLSQAQLAASLGLSRAKTISEWERGVKTPQPYIALAIAHLLARRK